MKRIFLAAGLLTLINPAFAQHKHGQEYNRSVFRDISPKSNREAIKETNRKAMAAFPQWGITVDKANGSVSDIYGPGMTLAGSTNVQRAQNCISSKMSGLGVNAAEWVMNANTHDDRGEWVNYEQVIAGHKVVFSKMRFSFASEGKLVRLQLKNYGTPQNYTSPVLSAADAVAASQQDMNGSTVTSNTISNDWSWFPVPTENGYELHPSWAFNIIGTDADKEPMLLRGYVDAINGNVLYRVNDVKFDYDLTVKGSVKASGIAGPVTDEPLPNLKLTIGTNTYYTDANGFYSNPSFIIPQSTTVSLAGKWSIVKDVPSNITAPSNVVLISGVGNTYVYATNTDIEERHVTAYYSVNVVHDFMKGKYPLFLGMDVALPTNVDLTTGNCNAFYNGSSINFYAAGSGCNSFAEINDVIYHEYGHGINDKYYDDVSGNSMENGALNEAYADVWALSITHNPILGADGFLSGGFIRRYDLAPKVYPNDIQGEVHADGEIIAGAWWDVGENLNDVNMMSDIFARSLNETPDGPDGTEGIVYHAALISALIADDDDANINNGTPHFLEIVDGFAEHGIYLLSDAEIDHTESANIAEFSNNDINGTLTITYQPFLKDVLLKYRVRPSTTWTDITMTETTPLAFTGQIPGQPAGSIIDYYFVVRDTLQYADGYSPLGYSPLLTSVKSNIPYQYGTQLAVQVSENFENTLTDWTVGSFTGGIGTFTADNATAGKWIQAVPIQSMANGLLSQTGNDHTSGSGKCLVTGNANSPTATIGAADVDGGITSVVTPIFDISTYDEPVVEYYRWYSNNRGSNAGTENWDVRIGTPSSPAWFTVDNTSVSDQSWRRRIFRIKDYVPAASQIQMIFRAEDKTTNGGATVEAAVDDFIIYSKGWLASVGNVPAAAKAEIYPNPANEMINIKLAKSKTGSIGIYDMTGKQVAEVSMDGNKTSYTMSTKNLAAGTYFLIVKSEGMIQSQKVVVAH